MKSRVVKYSIWFLVIALVGYNSVYFERLDAHNLSTSETTFDATAFARKFFDSELAPRLDSAVELRGLLALLGEDPEKAFGNYSHALAIGNVRYFLVRGEGTITSIREDVTYVTLKDDPTKRSIPLATEFVYGNAIRDASGLIDLSDFENTADVNRVSEEINSIVRKEVVALFTAEARTGDRVKFVGAIELNRAQVDINSIEVVPVRISIIR